MRPTRLLVPLLGLSSLACAGILEGKDEEGDTAADAIPVADVCQDYIDCTGATSPETLGTVADTYGEGGSCWESASMAETCEEACASAMEDLAEQYPEEPACGGQATPLDGCPFLDGTWSISTELYSDSCGFEFEGDYAHTVVCTDEGAGTFHLEGDLFTSLDCVTDEGARSFVCEYSSRQEALTLEATFDVFGTAADGSWYFEYDDGSNYCYTQGDVTMVYAD